MDELRFSKIEADVQEHSRVLSDMKTRLAVAENNILDIKASLESIKNNTSWIIRLIIGAFILAVIGFITQGGLKL